MCSCVSKVFYVFLKVLICFYSKRSVGNQEDSRCVHIRIVGEEHELLMTYVQTIRVIEH